MSAFADLLFDLLVLPDLPSDLPEPLPESPSPLVFSPVSFVCFVV